MIRQKIHIANVAVIATYLYITFTLCVSVSRNCQAEDSPQAKIILSAPFDSYARLPVVKAEFLGNESHFLLDTGASLTVVDPRYRLLLGERVGAIDAQAGGVAVPLDMFNERPLFLSGKELLGKIFVAPSSINLSLAGVAGSNGGCIGMDRFREYVIELNPNESMLRVYDRVPQDVVEGAESFGVVMLGNCVMVGAAIPDVGVENFLIDTGFMGGVALKKDLFNHSVKAGFIKNQFPTSASTGAGQIITECGQLQKIKLGSFQHLGLNAIRSDGVSLLGWEYLRRFVMVIDVPNNRLYMKPSKYHTDPDFLDMSGLTFGQLDGSIAVLGCVPGTAANDGGLKAGDRIDRVNDKPVEEYSGYDLRKLLSHAGDQVSLVVFREETEIKVSLKLRDYRIYDDPNATGKVLAEVPLLEDKEDLIIPVHCFGEVRRFQLNTTATVTILAPSFRPLLGVPVKTQDLVMKEGGNRTNIPTEVFANVDASVGGYSHKLENVICTDLRRKEVPPSIDGIIGLNTLSSLVWEINPSDHVLRIYDRVPDAVQESSDRVPIFFDRQSKNMKIAARISNLGTEQIMIATSNIPLILRDETFEQLVRSHSVRNRFSIKNNLPGLSTLDVGLLDQLQVGTFSHKYVRVGQSHVSAIGLGYLRRYISVFDMQRGALYLRPSIHFNDPEPPLGASGLLLFIRDGHVIVSDCQDRSPALEAGIKTGDRILEVNGQKVEANSLDSLRQQLTEVGQSVKITVQRGDEPPLHVEFVLKDYREYLPESIPARPFPKDE